MPTELTATRRCERRMRRQSISATRAMKTNSGIWVRRVDGSGVFQIRKRRSKDSAIAINKARSSRQVAPRGNRKTTASPGRGGVPVNSIELASMLHPAPFAGGNRTPSRRVELPAVVRGFLDVEIITLEKSFESIRRVGLRIGRSVSGTSKRSHEADAGDVWLCRRRVGRDMPWRAERA